MDVKVTEIKAALCFAADAYDALIQAVRPGASEQDLEAALVHAAGGREIGYDLLSGPRTAGVEGGATLRVLERGDAVMLDLCLKHGDHWCDVCRTFFLGKPDPVQQAAYETVLNCFAVVACQLRDGAGAGEVYKVAKDFLNDRGFVGWMRHHTGHGIGRTPFEAPVEVPESADVIHKGDVVTVEIGIYSTGTFGIRVEDDFLVTPDGAENLWNYPKALVDVTLPWTE